MNDRVKLYAASLYSLCDEENCIHEVYENLQMIEQILESNKEYIKIASSAFLSYEQREDIIKQAFEKRVHIYTFNFMMLLAKKRLFDIILPVIKEFESMYLVANNTEYAVITTAIEQNGEQQKQIIKRVSAILKKDVIAQFEVDQAIIGGIIIETSTQKIDSSVLGELKAMENYIGTSNLRS